MGVRQNPAGDGSTDSGVRRMNAGVPDRSSSDVPQPGRRRMVRGAAAAVPTILTLHSGSASALARSSNLISETSAPSGSDPCLEVSNDKVEKRGDNLYDLGESRDHRVWVQPTADTKFYKNEKMKGRSLGWKEACNHTKSDLYYEKGGETITWRKRDKPGILISAAPYASFSGTGRILPPKYL